MSCESVQIDSGYLVEDLKGKISGDRFPIVSVYLVEDLGWGLESNGRVTS
jgi:hypothetical protein